MLIVNNGGEAEQTRSNLVCLMKCGPKAAFTFLGALHSWVIFTLWKQQRSFSFLLLVGGALAL